MMDNKYKIDKYGCIIRIADNAVVPKDDLNRDYILFKQQKNTLVETYSAEEILKQEKDKLKANLTAFDGSSAVNSFNFKGTQLWINRADRATLLQRFDTELFANKTDTKAFMAFGIASLEIEKAKQMILAIEQYAILCYDKTLEHRIAIDALTTLEEVKKYDFKTGYPPKLSF